MAKGDQATQENAGSMQAAHAPLNFNLGGGSGGSGPRPFGFSGSNAPNGDMPSSSPIAPSQSPVMGQSPMMGNMMGGAAQMGGRMTGGMLPRANDMVGANSPTRMTGGGGMNSPIAPTDAGELIRRIMMMSRF